MWQLSDLKTIQILFQNSPNTKKNSQYNQLELVTLSLTKGKIENGKIQFSQRYFLNPLL